MYIFEELTKKENKKKFRELVLKHHPDKGGSEKIMKDLNIAKDKGDAAFEKFRNELTGKKSKQINWRDEFIGNLSSLQDHPKVDDLEGPKKTFGVGEQWQFILKSGNRISMYYRESNYNPVVEIKVFDKSGRDLEWETDNIYHNNLTVMSIKGALNAVKNILNASDTFKIYDWRQKDSGNDD